jgi:hypothetical protein
VIHVHKEYQKSFLVEPTKLRRLLDKIHERLGEHRNATLHNTFEVFFTRDRREEMTELDDVLALDNSHRKKITRLAITCSASSHGATRSDQEVQVDFGRPKPTSRGGSTNVVAISVRSDTAVSANRTFAEVEEQVERYWLNYEWPAGVLVGLLLVAMLLFGFQTVPARLSLSSDWWWLTSSDLDRIEAMLAQRPTLTDEDLREVSTTQLRNILEARKATRSAQQNWTRRTLLWAVPLSVVVACIVILVATCYPRAVFLWGDEEKRYESTLDRRKAIWGIIIAVTVVGVSSSFFYENVSSWFPR